LFYEPSVSEYWLCTNDLHVGSKCAPIPKKVKTKLLNGEEETITPNPVQKVINKAWDEMIENLPPLTGIILNGDLCDGPNRKGLGKGEWTTDLRTQVKACAELLRPAQKKLKKPSNIYVSQGSEYHVIDDRPLDQAVADELGGHYQPELLIPALKGDYRIQAHHVIGGGMGAWQYRTTSLARDHMLMELNNAEMEYGDLNCILRAHAHYSITIEFSPNKLAAICPPWQAKTEFAVKKGMVNVPRLGYSLLKIYEDGTGHIVHYTQKLVRPCKEMAVQ
jgi:hypothetical protein